MTDIIYTTTTTTTTTATLPPTFELLSAALAETFLRYLNSLDRLPGGKIILRYIKSSYKNDPGRSFFELGLLILALYYFLSSKKRENKSDYIKFTDREVQDLCDDWIPEPLVEDMIPLEKWQSKTTPVIIGANGSHVNLSTGQTNVLNLASYDFLNLNESSAVKETAIGVIQASGVGACGPPNFYGTQDVHVRLEEDLADFLDTEQAILYGQDFVTAGSVIPAFIKRGDICVVDSGVNIAIQKALIISRCDIEWYDHNDMEHLSKILEDLHTEVRKPLKRRLIVTEGIFANTGELANLPKIVELKNKYKYRLFLDETLSLGVLGKTGRGLTEHYGIDRSEVGITIGSLANSFAASGGFCAGPKEMVHHQRIQSNAYVFSASLPPYAAKVGSHAIKELTTNINSNGDSQLIVLLNNKIANLYDALDNAQNKFYQIVSSIDSPIIHLALSLELRETLDLPSLYGNSDFLLKRKQSKSLNEFDEYFNVESFIMQKIIDRTLSKTNILLTRSKQILEHVNLPVLPPRLLINVSVGATDQELQKLGEILPSIFDEVCSSLSDEQDLLQLNREITQY